MRSITGWEVRYQIKSSYYRPTFTFLFVCVFIVQLTIQQEMANSISDEAKALSESQNKFTRDLYAALAKSQTGNLFFSPFSISTGFAMVHIGSKENTEKELVSVMHYPENKTALRKGFKDLISEYKKESKDFELRTSNLVYISNKFTLLEDFTNALSDDFLSSSKLVDFAESETVRQEINAAVENETNSKIKDLIPSGVLDDLTRLVLVNAIYFKGLWVNQFDPADTKPQPFWVTATESVDVPMMTVEKEFRMAPKKDLDATLLALDYQGGRMSFVILLPNKRDGLAELEEKLSSVDFSELDGKASKIKVKVVLPKFKLEETLNLVPILKSMGLSDLFDENSCDLSDISGKKEVFVSHAIHKAFLEVNEEGSEAAAATASIVRLRRSLHMSETFVADHPFVFIIYDKNSLLPIFLGRFREPHTEKTVKDEL